MSRPPALALAISLLSGIVALNGVQAADNSADVDESATSEQSPARQADTGADADTPSGLSFAPRITLGLRFDDNIYATPDGEIEDLAVTLSPSVEARSNWQAHALTLRAGADITRYQDYQSEDTEDYWLEAKGRYDLSRDTKLFGGVRHSFAHEDRESADDLAGAAPTTYLDDSVHGGLLQRLGERASLRIGSSFRRLDYDNVPGLYNDDRDRDILTGAVQFSYELGAGYQWFSQAAVDQRRYRQALDDNGYHRDSAGYRLQTGLRWRQGDTRGDVYIGHMGQDYDAGNLSDVSALDLGASLSWQATPATVLRIAAERSIEETTLAGASSYLWTTLSAGVTHQLQPKLSITASLGAMESDYQGLAREDDFLTAALGTKYQLTRNGFLSASYRFLERDSNDATADFDRNQFALLVGWQF